MSANKFSYKMTESLQKSFDIVSTQLLTIIYKLKHTPFSVLGSTVVHFRTYWTRHGGRWNLKHVDVNSSTYDTTVKM